MGSCHEAFSPLGRIPNLHHEAQLGRLDAARELAAPFWETKPAKRRAWVGAVKGFAAPPSTRIGQGD